MISGYGVPLPLKNPVLPLIKEVRDETNPIFVSELLTSYNWIVIALERKDDGWRYILGRVN